MVNEPGRSRGVDLIAAERWRQQHNGYTVDYDSQHEDGELVAAAICYATPPEDREIGNTTGCPTQWPGDPGSFKTGSRVRDLQRAGALIAAEIDRLMIADGARTESTPGEFDRTAGAGAVCG